MKHNLISYVDKGTSNIVVCDGSLKLQTTKAIKLMCETYKSNQFIVIIYEGFA